MSTQTKSTNYKQYSRSKIREQATEYRKANPIPVKTKLKRSPAEQFINIIIRVIVVLIIITIVFHKDVEKLITVLAK